MKVNRNTNIADLVFKHPEVEEVLAAFGLHCASCFASGFDTLEQGAKIHEMPDEEIDEMIDDNVVLPAPFTPKRLKISP